MKKTVKPTFKLKKNTNPTLKVTLNKDARWQHPVIYGKTELKFKCIICTALPASSIRRKVAPKQYDICPYYAFKIPMKSHPEK